MTSKMEFLREGGKLECPFCHDGMFSMVSPGVFQCDKCHHGIIGRPKHGILGVRKSNIEEELKIVNKYDMINGRPCFWTKDEGFIRLDTIIGKKEGIVIEYAENREKMLSNRFKKREFFPSSESDEQLVRLIQEVIGF